MSHAAAMELSQRTDSPPSPPPVTVRGRGSVGLFNQGTTCYLNSLLQLLFHTTYFRSAVYKMTTDADDISSTPKALQLLFYQMQERDAPMPPKVLTDSFGWSHGDLMVQHDIHELITLLRDSIETKMKGTPAEGAINRLFTGISEKYFSCLDGSYTSRTREVFYDVQVQVQGFSDLMESLKSTLAVEQLTGSNKYRVEEEGKEPVYKDAETGTRYLKFPPVIVCHLKRIDIDLYSPTLEQKKINSYFQFPEELDLRDVEVGLPPGDKDNTPLEAGAKPTEAIYDLYGIIVHRGGVRSGHYFSYMREWSAEEDCWGEWMEFDDDAVRTVSMWTAMKSNFGGMVQRTNSSGMQVNVPSTQNAYILAYVRRGEINRVFYDVKTTEIPPHVTGEFEKIMAEEEEQRRKAEIAAQECHIAVMTDRDIAEHVRRSRFDIAHGREPHVSHTLTVRKSDPWLKVNEQLAALERTQPTNVRAWMCENRGLVTYGEGWRVVQESAMGFPLTSSNSRASTVGDEVGHRMKHPPPNNGPWSIVVYLEVATELPPHGTLTNAAWFATAKTSSLVQSREDVSAMSAVRDGQIVKLEQDDPDQEYRLDLEREHSVKGVSCRLHGGKHSAQRVTMCVELLHRNRIVSSTSQTLELSANYEPLIVKYNSPIRATAVRITRTGVNVYANLIEGTHFSRIVVTVPPEELQHHMQPPRMMMVGPKVTILVQVKYFNHQTSTLAYVGSCGIPSNGYLRNSLHILKALCGLPTGGAGGGNDNVLHTGLALFEERSPASVQELELDAYPTDHTGGAVNSLRHGGIVILQEDPRDIPLCFAHPRVDLYLRDIGDTRHVSIRRIDAPDTIVTTIPMQGRWKYDRAVDVIAHAVNENADFVRFYASNSVRHPAPRDEPERSDTAATLGDMMKVSDWPTQHLWYECLQLPRKQLESTVHVKLTIADERGTVADEAHLNVQFALQNTATAQDVGLEALRRVGQPFDRPWVLLVIFSKVIRYYFPILCDQENTKPIHRFFTRHSDRSFELRPYTPPTADEIEYPIAIGQYGTSPMMHGIPFMYNLPSTATPQVALAALLDVTNHTEEDLDRYKLMMFTADALYFKDFDTPLIDFWAQTPSDVPPSLMLEVKRPKEKPGSRYVAFNDPTLSIDKRKSAAAGGSGSAEKSSTTKGGGDPVKKGP